MLPNASTTQVWQQGVSVAGHPLCLQSDDSLLTQKLITELEGYCLERAILPSLNKPVPVIQFFWHEPPPPNPTETSTAAPPLELAHGECTLFANECHIRIDDVYLRIKAVPHAPIQIFAPPSAWHSNRFALGAVFVHAFHAALRRCHGFELHAAGLVNPINETGVLVIGPSGSGKSTLTVRLAEQGWRYLSDDSVLLSKSGSTVCAKPLRRILALTQTTAAACQVPLRAFDVCQVQSEALAKIFVAPEQLFGVSPTESCLPRHLVFPKLTQQATSELFPLSSSAALTKLLRQSPWSLYDTLTASEHIATLTSLVRQTLAWELFAGHDLLTQPTCAAKLLGKWLQ